MAGLEDDPEFWKSMKEGPSDDELEIPVVDLTGSSHTHLTCCSSKLNISGDSVEEKTTHKSPKVKHLAQVASEQQKGLPQRLPNGNFA